MSSIAFWLKNAKASRGHPSTSSAATIDEQEKLDLERAIAESLSESKGRQTDSKEDTEGFEIEDLTAWLEEQDKPQQDIPESSIRTPVFEDDHDSLSGSLSPRRQPIPSNFLLSSPPSELLFDTVSDDIVRSPYSGRVPSNLINSSPPSPLIFDHHNDQQWGARSRSPSRPQDANPFRALSSSESPEDYTHARLPQTVETTQPPVDVDQFVESMLVPRRVVAAPKRRRLYTFGREHTSLTESKSVECPLCGCRFSYSRIERHASDCTGTVSEAESDEDDNLGSAYLSSPTRPKTYVKPKALELPDWDEFKTERSRFFPIDQDDEKPDHGVCDLTEGSSSLE